MVEVNGEAFIARELTGAELRQLIADSQARGVDLIADGLSRDVSLLALSRMVGVEEARLMDLLPQTDWIPLEAAAKECNPRFFDLVGRATASLPTPSPSSTGQP